MTGVWHLLRDPRFFALWVGLIVSGVGDWINFIAMVSLVYQQTHSALMLAALRLFHIVPILLIAPAAGVFVDRWSRRRILFLAPLIAGVSVGVLVLVHPLPLVFCAYAAITIALMFFNPALSAVMPNIVDEEHLVAANALTQVTSTTSTVAGGLLGGLIVAAAGVQAAFLVDAVSFLFVAASVVPLKIVETHLGGTVRSVEHELVEGVRYLRAHADVAGVVLSGTVFIFATASVFTLGVAFVSGVLHAGTRGYGLMVAGMGAGSVVGALFMAALRDRIRGEIVFAGSGIGLGLAIAALGFSRSLGAAAGAYGASGLCEMANGIAGVTLLQRRVPDAMRGRIFAVYSTFDHVGAFGSTMAIAAGAGVLGTAGLIAGSGLVAAGTGILALLLLVWLRR